MINERSLLQQGGKKDERHARSSKRDWGGNMNELIIFDYLYLCLCVISMVESFLSVF